jgi:magnesium-transporting ATPase (P-type)
VNSIDMNCKETRNLLFIASSIVEGSGTALVVETGNKTVVVSFAVIIIAAI